MELLIIALSVIAIAISIAALWLHTYRPSVSSRHRLDPSGNLPRICLARWEAHTADVGRGFQRAAARQALEYYTRFNPVDRPPLTLEEAIDKAGLDRSDPVDAEIIAAFKQAHLEAQVPDQRVA